MRALHAILIAVVCAWSAGCDSEQYRAETRLLADGTIERIAYQPLARTPEKARKSTTWQESSRVRKVESGELHSLPLHDLLRVLKSDIPPANQQSQVPYWIGQGKFADAQAIPDHLVFEAPAGLSDGRLVRQVERREAGFVTEWIWQETLTDTINLTDHRLARTETADMVVALLLTACTDAWGPGYDLKNFEQWLRQDVAGSFQELCDATLQLGLNKHKPPGEPSDFLVQAAQILKRRGLDLLDAQQQPIKDQEEIRRRVQDYLTVTLQRLVRDEQDRPLQDEHLQDVLKTFAPPAGEDSNGGTRFTKAFSRAAVARFGTAKKFEEQLNLLGVRILGLYQWPILHGERNFDYRLEVPGIVIETNGTLLGDRTLRWKFPASDAFPLGYSMRAVVAVLQPEALQKHFPRARFDRREIIVEYLDLVSADADLRSALNDLVQRNDATAWKLWQVDHLEATRLFELLQP